MHAIVSCCFTLVYGIVQRDVIGYVLSITTTFVVLHGSYDDEQR